MRIVSKAEEQERLKAEALIRARQQQNTDNLVEQYLREDPHLYALNEVLLMTVHNRKDAEDDQIDWDQTVESSDKHDDLGSDVDFD